MFCKNCGKELRDGAKFCDHCGAAAENNPEGNNKTKPPKRKKHKTLILVSVLLLLAISAAMMYPLWKAFRPEREEMLTVYLLASRREYSNGALVAETQIKYNEMGLPVSFSSTGHTEKQCEVYYDDYGNRIREVTTQVMNGYTFETSDAVVYEYNSKGQPESAEIFYNEKLSYTAEFTYDHSGNLVLVEIPFEEIGAGVCWASFDYDTQGRLVQETFCFAQPLTIDDLELTLVNSILHRYEYRYEADGSVGMTVSVAGMDAETPAKPSEMKSLDFEIRETYDYTYTQSGIPVVLGGQTHPGRKRRPPVGGLDF